jgi:hypothetical protein
METFQKKSFKEKRPIQVLYFAILPMPFIEFGNVQGIITYKKNSGIEKARNVKEHTSQTRTTSEI